MGAVGSALVQARRQVPDVAAHRLQQAEGSNDYNIWFGRFYRSGAPSNARMHAQNDEHALICQTLPTCLPACPPACLVAFLLTDPPTYHPPIYLPTYPQLRITP